MCLTQGYHIVLFKAQNDPFFLRDTIFKGHTNKHTGHKLGAHWDTRLPFGVP